MRLSALAVLVLTACASVHTGTQPAAINVNVVAQSPLQLRDAELFDEIARQYVHEYARNALPLTLTITLRQGADLLAGRDASAMGGYGVLARTYPVESGHRVPLVGGMTAAEVGFVPTVSTSGGSIGGGVPAVFDAGIFAVYTISDASGHVLEKENLPLMESADAAFPALHLQQYHDAAVYIARRVARVH